MNESDASSDIRRHLVLLVAVLMGCASLASWWWGQGGSANFAAGATGRIGLVLGAIWLAWPSLKRPARWLPPGMAVLGVLLIAMLAAQPRLVAVAVPVFALLFAVATVVRSINRS